ncbi:MAG TPA: DNA methyltransferase [Sedimentisphaerales bacterium]|nr:DNA methyltransferase [Sedimentisphaerales bacterium]
MADDLKDLDNLKPIDHAVVAKPHTPVYKMHRYFARRPWSVFRSLIEHYSNPGSIILDPFCGGGVTVVEGLRLGRKVIGVDINPLATFITRMEVIDVDMDELKDAFEHVEAACREKIEKLYLTTCPKCGKKVPADWFEWSNVVECRECSNIVELHKAERAGKGEKVAGVSAGKYRCYHKGCKGEWRPSECKRLEDVLISVHVVCPKCRHKGEFQPTERDIDLARSVAENHRDRIKQDGLWHPTLEMPDWWDLRRPYNAHIKRFDQFFTPRNLFANTLIGTYIKNAKDKVDLSVRDLLGFVFSASLRFTNKMVFRSKGWQGGNPIEWASSTYWLPEVFCEINPWQAWKNRSRSIKSGKDYSTKEIGGKCVTAEKYEELMETSTAFIWTGSATKLPLPDSSIDVVITDPPYGNNVLYAELCNFYWAWVGGILDCNGLIDDEEEAVVSKEHKKGLSEYRTLLYEVFRECHRALKPGRWMVMTFHNKEFKVWNAIHLAAHDAGFKLAEHDGMIYQPPIANYTQTIQTRRSGSMLGDFILSFQKVEKQPEFRQIEHAEIGRQIERLAAEAVLHHKGASLSLIYMKLMPWLLNNNLLDKISEKELVPYLTNNFDEKDGKWQVKSNPGDDLKHALEEYSKQHYKKSYEELDFVPVEARIEYLIKRLLYSRGFATQDDILSKIYENLINSNMAEAREIQSVLNSIAKLIPISQAAAGKVSKGKAGRKVWKLKEDIEREKLFAELGADVEYRLATSEESDHDLAIARLVEIASSRNLKAHIGRTEQIKYAEFRKMSSDLPQRVKGMPKPAREIIEQIDVLWHNGGKGIVAAFEVERTSTITSGIDRFRNLLTAAPESEIELYLVVPKSRGNEVRNKLGSPANRKDGLHKKIGYMYLEDLKIRNSLDTVEFEKIRRFLNGAQ